MLSFQLSRRDSRRSAFSGAQFCRASNLPSFRVSVSEDDLLWHDQSFMQLDMMCTFVGLNPAVIMLMFQWK
jgi:hypothetical protein